MRVTAAGLGLTALVALGFAAATSLTGGRLLRGLGTGSRRLGGSRHASSPNPDGYAANLPKFSPMLDVLLAWNPDLAAEPLGGSKFDTLERLDWGVPEDRKRAFQLRDLEIPFKMFNLSNIDETVSKWKDDDYVIKSMGQRSSYMVNSAHNGHFMFYQGGAMHKELKKNLRPQSGYSSGEEAKNAFRSSGYTFDHPPPVPVPMTFREFWDASAALDKANAAKSPQEDAESKHLYLSTADSWRGHGATMIASDIQIFVEPETRRFFLPDESDIRGQHCRFGMRGVVAEQHWDGHRNSIYMLRGAKRYVLNPPHACTAMDIMHSGPSRRHAGIDFSDPDALADPGTAARLAAADTVETVLREGEVLYVPSYWLHYIVSLGRSIQCNTRSGISPIYADDAAAISKCESGEKLPEPSAADKSAAKAKVDAAIDDFRLPVA